MIAGAGAGVEQPPRRSLMLWGVANLGHPRESVLLLLFFFRSLFMRLAHRTYTGKKRFKMGFCNHKMTVYTKDRDVKRRFEKEGFTVKYSRALPVDKETSRRVFLSPRGVSVVTVADVRMYKKALGTVVVRRTDPALKKISDWFKPVVTI